MKSPRAQAFNVCPCCGSRLGRSRQRIPLWPGRRTAPVGEFEAMVLGCIDPRIQEPVREYMAARGLTSRFSQLTISGAAIGVVAPAFAEWQKAFWDNLAVSLRLHRIKRLIAIDHRDCGASRIAYGDDKLATPVRETETHRAALRIFRYEVAQRHPGLAVETGLMALDGSILMLR